MSDFVCLTCNWDGVNGCSIGNECFPCRHLRICEGEGIYKGWEFQSYIRGCGWGGVIVSTPEQNLMIWAWKFMPIVIKFRQSGVFNYLLISYPWQHDTPAITLARFPADSPRYLHMRLPPILNPTAISEVCGYMDMTSSTIAPYSSVLPVQNIEKLNHGSRLRYITIINQVTIFITDSNLTSAFY